MITGLEVTNFKAWQETGPIRFAPITVLFGTNSSGKSSIHQFLLMLKQTAESPDRRRDLDRSRRRSETNRPTRPWQLPLLSTGRTKWAAAIRAAAHLGTRGSEPPILKFEDYC